MSLSTASIDALVAAGVTVEQLAAFVKAQITADECARKIKREADAERKRKSRATVQDVTRTSCDGRGQSVTDADSDGRAVTQDALAPLHVRGENNLSRLDNIPNHTTLNASEPEPDLDWPEGDKPSRAYLDQLEAALRSVAGPALNPTSTRLFSLAPILGLGRNGAGPPCDMQADVFPTIRARSARAPPGSVKSWDFYTEAIREARDRRLTGAPAVEAQNQGSRHDRPNQQSRKLADKLDNMASAQRGFALAASRRPF